MEHLDLAGMVTTPINWHLPAFDQQDAIYLSNSRQMLEPILEETSEDEEHSQSSWNQYENTISFYSSAESETGSVIRIEVHKDADSISERDFACPAKRARRSQDLLLTPPTNGPPLQSNLEDTVVLRRYQRNENHNNEDNIFLAYEQPLRENLGHANTAPIATQRHSTGSRRFEDFYSDSDSISYHSLSRSSSLIQFESLERQMLLQEQHVSSNSLGASSPSLLSFDGSSTNKNMGTSEECVRSGGNSGNNSRRGSQSSLLRRFESSDGRLHQTYFDLDKLDFDDDEHDHEHDIRKSSSQLARLKTSAPTDAPCHLEVSSSMKTDIGLCQDVTDASMTGEVINSKNRNNTNKTCHSAENLSEDSGYSEPSSMTAVIKSGKSKNLTNNFEKFREEEEHDEFIEVEHEKSIWLTATEKINENLCNHHEDDPKINDATFVIENDDDDDDDEKTTTNSKSLYYGCSGKVKNSSPIQEVFERAFAHSPSPSSSVGSDSTRSSERSVRSSTDSASTRASAASFTWLPQQRNIETNKTQIQTSRELCTNFRSSLPDIRDVYGHNTDNTRNYFGDNGSQLEDFSIQRIRGISHFETSIPINNSPSAAINYTTISSITHATIPVRKEITDVEGSAAGWGCSGSDSDGDGDNRSQHTSSVPNELDKLVRHTDEEEEEEFHNTDEEFSSTEEAEKYDRFDNYCLNNRSGLRRACSWSDKQVSVASGYMNASYQNLTLLDYSGDQPTMNEKNLKRGNADQRQSIGSDYESIICKGNFLLDELSQIYDRNASILNDRTVDSLIEDASTRVKVLEEPATSSNKLPLVPPRRIKPISASFSDLENDSENDVQHVQLTIRQAPERHRHKRQAEPIKSSEINKSGSTTFDQDPTNLRTSYAQSLEKCNFDAKEVSTTDLRKVRSVPKRRFHSHAAMAKKKNLVSSTPNLNSFEANAEGDIDDDIYVSSAHTSMHRLPQTEGNAANGTNGGVQQKPLGILLPAGSRTSFGKEVSFCPVVSKYCWQEQSSEECNEPQLQRQDGQELDDEKLEKEEEENNGNNDELNPDDETVIFNTKENELIMARINEELQRREHEEELQKQRENACKEKENELVDSEVQLNTHSEDKECKPNYLIRTAAVAGNNTVDDGSGICKVSLKPTIISDASVENDDAHCTNNLINASEIIEEKEQAYNIQSNNNNNSVRNARPLSIQLPILSEPPTNRAHNILYASQQLLNHRNSSSDNDDNDDYIENQRHEFSQQPHYTQLKATSVSNLQQHLTTNMSQSQQQQQQQAKYININNNNNNNNNNSSETMKSKFKTDEKHPRSIGFLSRFANGLRFSLRRNKKKQPQQLPTTSGNNNNNDVTNKKDKKDKEIKQQNIQNNSNGGKRQKSPDFIYIPLKGPITNNNNSHLRSGNSSMLNSSNGSSTSYNNGSSNNSSRIGAKLSSFSSSTTNNTSTSTVGKIVTGKPPLPKQPPRSINNNNNNNSNNNSNNSMLQQSAGATHAHNNYQNNNNNNNNNNLQQQYGENHEQQMRFLDAERSYYEYGEDYEHEEHDNSNIVNAAVDYSGFRNQLMAGMQQANCHEAALASAVATAAAAPAAASLPAPEHNLREFTSPSRATVAQKTQLFQNLATQNNNSKTASNGRLVNSIIVQPLRKYNRNHPNANNCQQASHNGSKIGLIETNLDTHETIISGKTRSLLDIAADRSTGNKRHRFKKQPIGGHGEHNQHNNNDNGDDDDDDDDDDDEFNVEVDGVGVVIKSTTTNNQGGMSQIASVRRPHKSMEFLLDKENQKNVLPPENELQKSHENNPAALSEHQLRIQASLQRLNIPDWFRQYNQKSPNSPDGGAANGSASKSYQPGNFTRKRTTESGRWAGLNSKTTSLSSLGSQRSDRSPLLLSPSAHSHHGGGGQTAAHGTTSQTHGTAGSNVATNYGANQGGGGSSFSRWSTSHLNSSQTSPMASQRGSFTRGAAVNSSFMSVASGNSGVIRNSFRQPYMGWRSQEKLSQRTAHERLASSMLAQQQQQPPHVRPTTQRSGQVVTPEIQSSIKEVTSAIVHYVNDQTNNPERSRSTSPNSRKCWLESSFVGVRPLDSPQTPIIDNSGNTTTATTTTTQGATSAQNLNRSTFNVTSAPYFLNSPNNFGITLGACEPTTITTATTTNVDVLRINGLSICEGPKRSLSTASLEDVLASLLGLPSATSNSSGGVASSTDAYARSTTGGTVNQPTFSTFRPMPQQLQQLHQHLIPLLTTTTTTTTTTATTTNNNNNNQLLDIDCQQQQRLRRSSEGDKPKQTLQQQQQLIDNNANERRISLGDSSESIAPKSLTNAPPATTTTTTTSGEQQIVKCRNTKCDASTNAADAKKYYKSCHNCTHLYCSRECRRAHWEKHRKACLHSRASNLCRQVLATCKDDPDSQRHLSLLARKGVLSQGRGVVRVLFRSAEASESFIKHGFQCMGEATYVRWPDLAPAEMGLELYTELLKLSMEYKTDSKMLIYVAICVISEAPGTGQSAVRWERQLVSRCAKLKLCKNIVSELKQQATPMQNVALVAVPEPATEILILTFNPAHSTSQRELILNNILGLLLRRGVILRKHYPEIFQRLQSYADGQTDKFNAVTLHPRDTHTGQGFVCIIMPVNTDSELIRLPSVADGGNRVTTVDVGSPTALGQHNVQVDVASGIS